MTDHQQDQLIDLGLLSPEVGAMAAEWARLAELCQNDGVKTMLTGVLDGYLMTPQFEVDPHLEPLPMNAPDKIYTGPDGVGDLHTVTSAEGYAVSVWQCKSFMHRMQFLFHGSVAVCIPPGSPVPAMALRLDVTSMGFAFGSERVGVERGSDDDLETA